MRIPRVLASLAPALALAMTATATAAPAEREVEFAGAGGLTLHGALVLPEGATADAPVPGVLILPGSGPTDRDGNQPPALITDLLKQLSAALADAGVASLRFDKRGVARYMSSWPQDDTIGAFFSYDKFIGDAEAAYAFLRAQPGVAAAQTGIIGHSEGGLFTLQIAADLAGKPDAPAAIVLLSTAGRSLDVVVREQIAAQLGRAKADEATRKLYLDALDASIATVKAGKVVNSEELPPGLGALFNPSASELLKAYFSVDPAALATKVACPVLLLQGDADAQISVDRDFPVLEKALESRPDGEDRTKAVIIKGASHNLKPVTSESDPGFAGPMSEEAKKAVVEWVVATLG